MSDRMAWWEILIEFQSTLEECINAEDGSCDVAYLKFNFCHTTQPTDVLQTINLGENDITSPVAERGLISRGSVVSLPRDAAMLARSWES